MAAASPVLIHSSPPPPSLRCLSVTPPSAQRHEICSSNKTSSSPRLPSPSTFVPRRPIGLKSGSRAQPAPEGAKLGFVSAGSLWRDLPVAIENYGIKTAVELPGSSAEPGKDKSRTEVAEATGKLTKPKKTAQVTATSRSGVDNERLTTENVYDIAVQAAAATAPSCDGRNDGPMARPAIKKAKKPRGTGQTGVAKPKGRPRKEAKLSAACDDTSTSTRKKTSKQNAKSEETIFDSDDPELDAIARAGQKSTRDPPPGDLPDSERPPSKRKTAAKPRKKPQKAIEKHQNEARLVTTGVRHLAVREDAEKIDALQHSIYFSKDFNQSTTVVPLGDELDVSVYFSKPAIPPSISAEDATANLGGADQTDLEINVAAPPIRRRRSWTPARDTEVVPQQVSRPTTAGSQLSESDAKPGLSLAGMIGDFSYIPTDMPPPISAVRTPSGEAKTKRRRIELVDPAVVDSLPRIDARVATVKTARKKAPKKKPQTITAVATAAFLPPKPPEAQPENASTYFTSVDVATHAVVHDGKESNMPPPAIKLKKARQPRKKAGEGAKGSAKKSSSKPKVRKIARVKKDPKPVKRNELEDRPKLYSPERAVAHIQNQSFLFGTSSQLAPTKSTQFIKDMQVALHESEQDYPELRELSSPFMGSSQRIRSPQKKSCVKIPTAPHGTSLSIEQGTRELWSTGARDFGGGLLAVERQDLNQRQLCLEPVQPPSPTKTQIDVPAVPLLTVEPVVVEVNTSPITETVTETFPVLDTRRESESKADVRNNCIEEDDDSWMLLSSDGHFDMPAQHGCSIPTQPMAHDPTLPIRSPPAFLAPKQAFASPYRRALHPLDSNLKLSNNVLEKPSAPAQARAFTSTTPKGARQSTNSHGRAPTPSDASNIVATVPKKRGRPPKTTMSTLNSISKVARSKPSRSDTSKSQPGPRSSWLDIDEISDSETPNTPSPPRRRATSSPSEMPRLILSPSKLDVAGPVLPAPFATHSLKPDGPQWPQLKPVLFPQITQRLKSDRDGADAEKLSWWQKILLYHPIVVEDLTEWLNEQGVCVQVSKKKAVAKTKKGKGSAEESGMVQETEICSELLQPWMVQKWCEEHSVCCYLKKGSWRGGRKTKP